MTTIDASRWDFTSSTDGLECDLRLDLEPNDSGYAPINGRAGGAHEQGGEVFKHNLCFI